MQAERDELIKNTFPQLKQLCLERGMFLTVVDLRWGITAHQAENNKVIPICLREIEKCRPFFIALLGERYGWIPEKIHPEVTQEYSWITNYENISLTEMEIRHGFLNHPDDTPYALFYFRDTAYQTGGKKRKQFYKESPHAIEKLHRLKDEIRNSEGKVYDNYKNPKEVALQILQDVTHIINQVSSENPLLKEKRVAIYREIIGNEEAPRGTSYKYFRQNQLIQEVFKNRFRQVFAGREAYIKLLDEFVEGKNQTLVLYGPEGIGKSALLTQWTQQYSLHNPKRCLVTHHIGNTRLKSIRKVLRQISWEVINYYTPQQSDYFEPQEHGTSFFLKTLKEVDQKGGAIVIFDGLEQLPVDERKNPDWLPDEFPASTRIIISVTQGKTLDILQKRSKWIFKELTGFSRSEQRRMIVEYLAIYGKSLSKTQLTQILDDPDTNNPWYLKTLLEELRIFGVFEQLDEKINLYLEAESTPQLYHKILDRLESDYNQKRKKIVNLTFQHLNTAKNNALSEDELRAILQLTPLAWSQFYFAIEDLVIDELGLIKCKDQRFVEVTHQRYLSKPKEKTLTHAKLARFFQKQENTKRKAEELPYHYHKLGKWEELKNCLLNLELLRHFDEEGLLHYWQAPAQNYDPGTEYIHLLKNITAEDFLQQQFIIQTIRSFLRKANYIQAYEQVLRIIIAFNEDIEKPEMLTYTSALNDLSILLSDRGQHKEAKKFAQKALSLQESEYTLMILGIIAQREKNYEEAETLFQRALDLHTSSPQFPPVSPDIIYKSLGNVMNVTHRLEEAEKSYRRAVSLNENSQNLKTLADFLNYQKNDTAAESYYQQALGTAAPEMMAQIYKGLADLSKRINRLAGTESYYRQALSINEKHQRESHPQTSIILNELGELLRESNRLDEAEPLFRRSLMIDEKNYGQRSINKTSTLNNLALLLLQTNRILEAEQLFLSAIQIHEEQNVIDERFVQIISNYAELLKQTNRFSAAERHYRWALSINEKESLHSPIVPEILNSLGLLLNDLQRYEEAETLLKKALSINEKQHGAEARGVADTLNNLGLLMSNRYLFAEAEQNYRKAIFIYEKNKEETSLAVTLTNMANLYSQTKKTDEALSYYQRALDISEKVFGPHHPDVGINLNGLANQLKAKKHFDKAEELYERALSIFQNSYGPKHPTVANISACMAGLYAEMQDYQKAESFYRKSINTWKSIYSPSHALLAGVYHGLGNLLKDQKKYKEAEDDVQRAITIREQTYGTDHLSLVKPLSTLSDIFLLSNRTSEAIAVLERAFAIQKASSPDDQLTATLEAKLKKIREV